MRAVGGATAQCRRIGVEAFRLTYDIADQREQPDGVRMDADDLAGGGACDVPSPCSENQIRKVNVVLSMPARELDGAACWSTGDNSQNTLYTQVSLRSLAFVDRYR